MAAQVIYVDFAARARIRGVPGPAAADRKPDAAAAPPAPASMTPIPAVAPAPPLSGVLARMPATASLGDIVRTLRTSSAGAAAAFAALRAGSEELRMLSGALTNDAAKMAASVREAASAIGTLNTRIRALAEQRSRGA